MGTNARAGRLMSEKTPIVAVVGAGAVGAPVATFLTKAGVPVQVAVKRPEIRRAVEERGLVVQGVRGRHVARFRAVEAIEDLEGYLDVAFLAVKTFDTLDAARRLKAKLSEDGVVVTLQNGITVDEVSSALGTGRVLGCVVEWGATMIEPGHVEVTSKGRFMLGEVDGTLTSRLHLVKELLAHTYPVELVEDIRGALYSKLIVNSCITTSGAITGLTLGKILADKQARLLFLAVVTEGVRVARAAKVRLYTVANGRLRPETLSLDTSSGMASGFDLWKKHALLRLVGLKYRRLKSSMLQSLERGGRTEVDAINGTIVAWGKKHGVATPVNEALVRMVHEIEAGSRKSSRRNLDEIPL